MTDKATILEFLAFKVNNKEIYEKLALRFEKTAILVGFTQGPEAEEEFWIHLEKELLDPNLISSLQDFVGTRLFPPTVH